jgi:hypothetical protein
MGHEPRKPGRDGIREILESGRAPNFSVRGGRRNLEMADADKIPVDSRFEPLGRNAAQLERDYESDVAAKNRYEARLKRARGSSRKRDGELRFMGRVPYPEYLAVRKKVGEQGVKNGDLTEELKRRGRIRES